VNRSEFFFETFLQIIKNFIAQNVDNGNFVNFLKILFSYNRQAYWSPLHTWIGLFIVYIFKYFFC